MSNRLARQRPVRLSDSFRFLAPGFRRAAPDYERGNMKKIATTATLALLLMGCGAENATDGGAARADEEKLADNIEQQADALEAMADKAIASTTAPSLPASQVRSVCKAAVAQMFGHSPSIMKATGDELIRVTYRRPDDGKTFSNECKLEGDRIVWRSVDATPGAGLGPWRTREGDDDLRFRVDGKNVKITTTYSDGSVVTESQPLV